MSPGGRFFVVREGGEGGVDWSNAGSVFQVLGQNVRSILVSGRWGP